MDPLDLLATVPVRSAALVEAAEAAGLDTPVPGCQDWAVRDLLHHLGKVVRFIHEVVRTGGLEGHQTAGPAPGDDAGLRRWVEAGTTALTARLTATDPSAPVWNWAGADPVAAFWHRRAAHEVAVHAADALGAAGRPVELVLTPELASDGIDELLTCLLPAFVSQSRVDLTGLGTLHVHCTDTPGEWLVVPGEGTVAVTRAHAKGQAALRGSAADTLLRLYNRRPAGEVVGDPGVLERWAAKVRF